MIDISKIRLSHLEKSINTLKQSFLDYIDDKVVLPGALKHVAFSNTFFDSEFYLAFPYAFKDIFNECNKGFAQKISISGFFYFKYLLCLDTLHDKDDASTTEQEGRESILLLQSHIYHEESLKILATLFGKSSMFWDMWNQRNHEFLSSILLDKVYNINMDAEIYFKLSMGKCSFSKVAVDAYYARSSKSDKIHENLTKSIDYFSVARCIQDDLEDFKKDIIHKKNNLGHILINKWLISKNKVLEDYSPETLERYLFTSETAEEMMLLSKSFYQKAIDQVEEYRHCLSDYIKTLELLRNRITYMKVSVHSYRINKIIKGITSTQLVVPLALSKAIELSNSYISRLQNQDGSWFEITNMQGLSNVWSTGYIASFLQEQDHSFSRANNFLLTHQQDHLWGYNTDWTFDYDSTTNVLLALNKASICVEPHMRRWFSGQTEAGGFGTYSPNENTLASRMGLKDNQVTGWTSTHVCVSALAYYFLNQVPGVSNYQPQLNRLKSYLLQNRSANGTWKPYWWTSFLYPTCYVLQAMMLDQDDFGDQIRQSLLYIVSKQNKDGSFSCEVLKQKSVYYTALVLDTICASPDVFVDFEVSAIRMKNWILANQHEDGAFTGSNFLVIPNPTTMSWYPFKRRLQINNAGGGNSITGEVANLFSTAVALRALRRYRHLSRHEHENH